MFFNQNNPGHIQASMDRMAELQGGKLDLYIDGDLFKAILRIPAID